MKHISKIFISFCFIVRIASSSCMEHIDSKSNTFKCITTWDQVIPFAGQIIAYKASSFYFRNDAFKLRPSDLWNYGYISSTTKFWTDDDQGYALKRLLHKRGVQSNCALINYFLEESHVYMRIATQEEKEIILQLLNAEEVKFDFMSFNENEIRSVLAYK